MKTRGVKVIAAILVFVLMFTYFNIVQKAVAIATNEVLENVALTNGENTVSNTQENELLGTIARIFGA